MSSEGIRVVTLQKGTILRCGNGGGPGYEDILIAFRPGNHYAGLTISGWQRGSQLSKQDKSLWRLAPTSTEPLIGWVSDTYGVLTPRDILQLLSLGSFGHLIPDIAEELSHPESRPFVIRP